MTLGRTLGALMSVDLGVTGERALTVETTLPLARYDSLERLAAFHEQMEPAVRGIPGVEAVGATNYMPGTREIGIGRRIAIEGRSAPEGAQRGATDLLASADFFRAIGIPLIVGRHFTHADRERAVRAVPVPRVPCRCLSDAAEEGGNLRQAHSCCAQTP